MFNNVADPRALHVAIARADGNARADDIVRAHTRADDNADTLADHSCADARADDNAADTRADDGAADRDVRADIRNVSRELLHL